MDNSSHTIDMIILIFSIHLANPLTTPYEASLSTEAALRSHKSTQRTIDIFFYVYTASLLSGICAIVLEIWGVTLTAWRMEEEPKFPANWKKMHHNPIRLTCLGVELSWVRTAPKAEDQDETSGLITRPPFTAFLQHPMVFLQY